MQTTTSTIVFDVNETLSDMSSMAQHFAEVGAPESAAGLWFASVLRDGFAQAVAGSNVPFAIVARETLAAVFAGEHLNRSIEEAVDHILKRFQELPVHPDVPGAVEALAQQGLRLVALTNGAAQTAETLLANAGIREHFSAVLSVQEAPLWKPAPQAYHYAAEACSAAPESMLLTAVHPWDIDGAARAGLRTAWLNRRGNPYPVYARTPSLTVSSLAELAELSAERFQGGRAG